MPARRTARRPSQKPRPRVFRLRKPCVGRSHLAPLPGLAPSGEGRLPPGTAHLLLQVPYNHQVCACGCAVLLRRLPGGPLDGEKVAGALEGQPGFGALLAGACGVARVREVKRSLAGRMEKTRGRCPPPRCRGGGTENRPRSRGRAGQGGSRKPRKPRPTGRVHLSPPLSPLSVSLTVPLPDGLQSPEQLGSDALAVPARLGQALGHCEVMGVRVTAQVRVRTRVTIS